MGGRELRQIPLCSNTLLKHARLAPESARLATPTSAQSWDEKNLLNKRGDMVNVVNTETMQTAAKKLATAIVDKMQEVSELKKELWLAEANGHAHTSHAVVEMKQSESKGKATEGKATDGDKALEEEAGKQAANEEAKKKTKEHEKKVLKARQVWAKANPQDKAKVAELKKVLLNAEKAKSNTKGTSAKVWSSPEAFARKLARQIAVLQSMKQTDTKGEAEADDKAEEEAKKKAEERAKEVIEERQDWSKANPTDDAKVAELKKELWHAEANGDAAKGEAHTVIAMSQSETKGKAADGDNMDKAKEEAIVSEATEEAKKKNKAAEEAKKQAANKEHEREVIKVRQDWSKANPADDAKVAELKKELWRAEEAQGKAHDKVARERERERERERGERERESRERAESTEREREKRREKRERGGGTHTHTQD